MVYYLNMHVYIDCNGYIKSLFMLYLGGPWCSGRAKGEGTQVNSQNKKTARTLKITFFSRGIKKRSSLNSQIVLG